jgi:transposase, IS5 family
MRENIVRQLPLVLPLVPHVHAHELRRMSEVLDRLPQLGGLVARDLTKDRASKAIGRVGMSGEQVLRAAVLKQMMQWSYSELAFHLLDSNSYRAFCHVGLMDRAPKRATLHANIKQISAESLEQINRLIVARAKRTGVEDGKRSRIDSTVVDTNIHHPADSSLLWDVVRVLTRLLKRSARLCGRVEFSNHARRARRRQLAIGNVPTMAMRVPLYLDLLKVTRWTMAYAQTAAVALEKAGKPAQMAMAAELRRYEQLGQRVVDQAERRVVHGESVAATEKIVSIFEPHSDVIVKGGRDTQYGHKAFVNVGASGIVLDLLIERGNPSDSTQAIPMLKRHRSVCGSVPTEVAFDAGFTSNANLVDAKKLGVPNASFAKKGSMNVLDTMREPNAHRRLQRFRAGVEGIISFAKRCFGFGRCKWRGYGSFRSYAWLSVVSSNLLLIARHMMR